MASNNVSLTTQEAKEHIRFVVDVLTDIKKQLTLSAHSDFGSPQESMGISDSDMCNIINAHLKAKEYLNTNHGKRITHLILYLNTQLENCNWIKNDTALNLKRFVHGLPISTEIYFRIVEVMSLKPFIAEAIMSTPYCFCRDLVEIYCSEIKIMDSLALLKSSESLIIALMKSIKRAPVDTSLHSSLISHFNRSIIVYTKEYLPNDVKKVNKEIDKSLVTKYFGYRLRSIFKIYVEIIKYINTPDTYTLYPMYKLKSLRTTDESPDTENIFKQFIETVMYKCMDLCDFSIDDWLAWYEVEVLEEDTNLQTSIGHLCYELRSFIDNGTIKDNCLQEFRPVLSNMVIEKIDFANFDVNDIDIMITHIENSPKSHLNAWIKKMIENHNVFISPRAILSLDNCVDRIDYNCFKSIIDQCMIFYKNGGEVFETMGNVLYKGIKNLDMIDKKSILRFVITHHADNSFYFSNDFDEILHVAVHSKYENSDNNNEIVTKLMWLTIQQPKAMLHTLISEYITDVGIFLCSPIGYASRQRHLQSILVEIHKYIDINYIYEEYKTWLNFDSNITSNQRDNLRRWICDHVCGLDVITPKDFLANILLPLLKPSPNCEQLLFLMKLIKFFLAESQLVALPEICLWDKLLIQLAKVLDDSRSSINNYTDVKAKLCEDIITCIQPLLHYASYIGKQSELDNIKQELSNMHLITQAHFFRLWPHRHIIIDGMEEQFVMTVHSQNHISYSNLNSKSTQRAQEEFIFSIATYFPKFTLREVKCFVTHYMISAKPENVIEASYFFLGCVMNAFMRIIVYLKTAVLNKYAWDYLGNAIENFLDTLNHSKMCSIYNEQIKIDEGIYGITKIIMVVKQMENSRQAELLIVARRIYELLLKNPQLNNDHVSKLLSLLSSVKTTNCREIMRHVIDILIDKLEI